MKNYLILALFITLFSCQNEDIEPLEARKRAVAFSNSNEYICQQNNSGVVVRLLEYHYYQGYYGELRFKYEMEPVPFKEIRIPITKGRTVDFHSGILNNVNFRLEPGKSWEGVNYIVLERTGMLRTDPYQIEFSVYGYKKLSDFKVQNWEVKVWYPNWSGTYSKKLVWTLKAC